MSLLSLLLSLVPVIITETDVINVLSLVHKNVLDSPGDACLLLTHQNYVQLEIIMYLFSPDIISHSTENVW